MASSQQKQQQQTPIKPKPLLQNRRRKSVEAIDVAAKTDGDDRVSSVSNGRLVLSLQSNINALEYELQCTRVESTEMVSKYDLLQKENALLKGLQSKYNLKCAQYDQLREHYDSMKCEFLSLQQSHQNLLQRIKEVQSHKDDLSLKLREVHRENEALLTQSLAWKEDVVALSTALHESQSELNAIKQVKADENRHQLNSFTDEIRKLSLKLNDVYKENDELRRMHRVHMAMLNDRESLDEEDDEEHKQPQSEPRVFAYGTPPPQHHHHHHHHHHINYRKSGSKSAPRSRALSAKSSHNNSPNTRNNLEIEPLWAGNNCNGNRRKSMDIARLFAENMESLMAEHAFSADNDEDDKNGDAEEVAIVMEISESLWHAIDVEVIKIESLLKHQSQSPLPCTDSAAAAVEEHKMTYEYEYHIAIEEDQIERLPQRLECLYHVLQKWDMNNMERQSLIALNRMKIQNLHNKVIELKSQKDSLSMQLTHLTAFYERYKQTASKYINAYNASLRSTISKMIKLKYWQKQMRRYGITAALLLLAFLYLLYRYKNRHKTRVRQRIKMLFGY